jgi:hypothetical protein
MKGLGLTNVKPIRVIPFFLGSLGRPILISGEGVNGEW